MSKETAGKRGERGTDGSVVAFSFPIIAVAVAFVLVVIAWKKSCPDSFAGAVVVAVGVFFSSNAKSPLLGSFTCSIQLWENSSVPRADFNILFKFG